MSPAITLVFKIAIFHSGRPAQPANCCICFIMSSYINNVVDTTLLRPIVKCFFRALEWDAQGWRLAYPNAGDGRGACCAIGFVFGKLAAEQRAIVAHSAELWARGPKYLQAPAGAKEKGLLSTHTWLNPTGAGLRGRPPVPCMSRPRPLPSTAAISASACSISTLRYFHSSDFPGRKLH